MFQSILVDAAETPPPDSSVAAPDYFTDLHLDDVEGALVAGRDADGLAAVFRSPLRDVATIGYRHEVFRDLEDDRLREAIHSFGSRMDVAQRRAAHSSRAHYPLDQQRWLLAAADTYCAALTELNDRLLQLSPRSTGLSAFRGHLATYLGSDPFGTLAADTRRARTAVVEVTYRLRIHGPKVSISRFAGEPDFGSEVLETFERFRPDGDHARYDWRFEPGSDMNHVEAAILDRVAGLEPAGFAALGDYWQKHRGFLDPVIVRFAREVRFYLAWIDLMDRIREGEALEFCYPDVGRSSQIQADRTYDLALAISLAHEERPVVPNDLDLADGERIVLISGPNQGGKTTFARAIGQLDHLARIGVPVPGERVRLPLVDRIFTHFERREQVEDLRSKLEDDLRRIRAVLDQATSDSLLIMNESFSSTTVEDQLFIGRQVIRRILDLGAACVFVTFLDELAALDPRIVSMVGNVDPADDTRRTYEIVRRPPDGLAYALAIAEKHAVTYRRIADRLSR